MHDQLWNDSRPVSIRREERRRRFTPINDAVAAEKAYDRRIAIAAVQRFSRDSLTVAELLAEVEHMERQIIYLQSFPPGSDSDNDLDWYHKAYEEATDRLDRLVTHSKPSPRQTAGLDFHKARYVDLVDLAQTLTGQEAVKSGELYLLSCPFHPEDTPSLTIYPPGRGWYCFGCRKGGQDAVSFVADLKHISMVEALRIVEEMCDVAS